MESYPVDIDPEQVVRWVREEQRVAPSALAITARRTDEVQEIPLRTEIHLGDAEREDFSEVARVATLEIRPVHASDGWLLTVVIENEAAPRMPEKGTILEPDEEIDLGTFCREFVRPGAGTANVFAEVQDAAAKARLDALLDRIERNYHGPAGPARAVGP